MFFRMEKAKIDLKRLAQTYGALPKKVNEDIGLAYRKHRDEKMSQGLNLDTLKPMQKLKPATIKAKIRKGNPQPTTPLVGTGNMKRGTNVVAKDGLLEISQGVTRAEIQAFHQVGANPNPARVTLAWNQEFVRNHMYPLIKNHYMKMIQAARRGSV